MGRGRGYPPVSLSSSDDTTTVFVFDFRPVNNERSGLENNRVCDLVWECERGPGLDTELEDDEELPERRCVGNDRVLMKRWVRAGNEFDRARKEDWTSHESICTTECLRMVKTLTWAKYTGECIVGAFSSQKSLFMYLWQVKPTDLLPCGTGETEALR